VETPKVCGVDHPIGQREEAGAEAKRGAAAILLRAAIHAAA
jgi:hypothetical protein